MGSRQPAGQTAGVPGCELSCPGRACAPAAPWVREIDGCTASACDVLQWGSDPLWGALVPVTASMLLSAAAAAAAARPADAQGRNKAQPAQDRAGVPVLLVGGTRAIRRVRLLGDVVCIRERSSLVEFTLDDCTGLLPCQLWKSDLGDLGGDPQALQMGANLSQILPGLQLGRLLHVGGLIQHYRGQMQLNVKFLAPEHHADGLSLFWLQTIHLHTSVYPTAAGEASKGAEGRKRLRDPHDLPSAADAAPDCPGRAGSDGTKPMRSHDLHDSAAGKGTRGHGDQGKRHDTEEALKGALDEELLCVFSGAHDARAHEMSSSASGRELLFSDIVQDTRVLEAARKATAGGAVPLKTAIAHGILRLKDKGWIVLVDADQDSYMYVGTAQELSMPVLGMLQQLDEELGSGTRHEMTLDDILDQARRHTWLRHIVRGNEICRDGERHVQHAHKSIQAALEYLVAEKLLLSSPETRAFFLETTTQKIASK